MPKVSVVVPVYKVEKYIERCVRSLFEQTLEDIEYIFINDCTPDRSVEILQKILKEYPHRQFQVKLIHHERNLGTATVRNTGLREAQGKYIIYCDSDDWVEKDMYEKMYNKAIETEADIVGCDCYVEHNDCSKHVIQKLFNHPSDCLRAVLKEKISGYTWNKLVKRELYTEHHIYFLDGINMWEDLGVLVQQLYYCRKVVYMSFPFYHYVQYNPGSVVHNLTLKQLNEMISVCELIGEFFKKNGSFDSYRLDFVCLALRVKYPLILQKEWRNYRRFQQLWPEFDKDIWNIGLRWDIRLMYWLASRKLYCLSRSIFIGKEKIRRFLS